MNKVILMGRLTRDPEVRFSGRNATAILVFLITHDYTGAKYSTANQVAKIGNSVVPIMAKLLVQANCCNGEEATQNENC